MGTRDSGYLCLRRTTERIFLEAFMYACVRMCVARCGVNPPAWDWNVDDQTSDAAPCVIALSSPGTNRSSASAFPPSTVVIFSFRLLRMLLTELISEFIQNIYTTHARQKRQNKNAGSCLERSSVATIVSPRADSIARSVNGGPGFVRAGKQLLCIRFRQQQACPEGRRSSESLENR